MLCYYYIISEEHILEINKPLHYVCIRDAMQWHYLCLYLFSAANILICIWIETQSGMA